VKCPALGVSWPDTGHYLICGLRMWCQLEEDFVKANPAGVREVEQGEGRDPGIEFFWLPVLTIVICIVAIPRTALCDTAQHNVYWAYGAVTLVQL
jgi:hypothetical protein